MLPQDRRRVHSRNGDAEPLISLGLTPREADVLVWITQGKTNYEIGVILGAAPGTIRKHVEHILAKLNVENRTAAAAVALQTPNQFSRRLAQRWRGSHSVIIGFIFERLVDWWSDGEIYTAMGALIDGCGS
jgi:DNA-binding CsgD family transcriptional regulator